MIAACREAKSPLTGPPCTAKSNKYPKRGEIGRQLDGGDGWWRWQRSVFSNFSSRVLIFNSATFPVDGAWRVSCSEDGASPVSTGKENHGLFAAAPSAGAGYSGSPCLAACERLTCNSSNRSAGLATLNQTGSERSSTSGAVPAAMRSLRRER